MLFPIFVVNAKQLSKRIVKIKFCNRSSSYFFSQSVWCLCPISSYRYLVVNNENVYVLNSPLIYPHGEKLNSVNYRWIFDNVPLKLVFNMKKCKAKTDKCYTINCITIVFNAILTLSSRQISLFHSENLRLFNCI